MKFVKDIHGSYYNIDKIAVFEVDGDDECYSIVFYADDVRNIWSEYYRTRMQAQESLDEFMKKVNS